MSVTLTHAKKTPTGNIIFGSSFWSGALALSRPPNLSKIGITANTPLDKVKIRRHRYTGPEGLTKDIREKLEAIGIVSVGDLLTRRKNVKVKTIIARAYCNEINGYMTALVKVLPHLVDKTYVIPEAIDIGQLEITGELAKTVRGLESAVRDNLTETATRLVMSNLATLIDTARNDFLQKRELELTAQLAEVRCKLAGGTNC